MNELIQITNVKHFDGNAMFACALLVVIEEQHRMGKTVLVASKTIR